MDDRKLRDHHRQKHGEGFLANWDAGPRGRTEAAHQPMGVLGASTPAKYINKVTVFRGGTLRNCFRAPGECLPGSTNARSA
jgi:hypothetical protein